MSKRFLALVMLLAAGAAGAETIEVDGDEYIYLPGFDHIDEDESSEVYFIDTKGTSLFWEEPECPEGWGRVVVKMPPGYDYETVTVECGLVVEVDDE